MDGERAESGHGEWRGRSHVRAAMLVTAAGALLALATIVLGFVTDISPQGAIALAMVATLSTLGGMLGVIVPDPWAAWRRGFAQGCKAAETYQTHRLPSETAGKPTQDTAGEHVVIDLPVRYGTVAEGRSRHNRY